MRGLRGGKAVSNGEIFEFESKNRSFSIHGGCIVSLRSNKKNMNTSTNGRASYASDEERWRAVVRKDRNADGKFFYSVKTTGVYCRPSCFARPARRENVTFHKSPEDAERAGFRACKRCKPKGPASAEKHAAMVAAACSAIETAEESPDLDALASSAGMSRFHFHRIFKSVTGLTPKAFAAAHRSERMRKELPKRNSITEAIYEAGFNSNGRFYASSSEMLGMKPKNYRGGGAGATIRFAIGQCSLGSILVAASEKGVCAIMMGDDPMRWPETSKIAFRRLTSSAPTATSKDWLPKSSASSRRRKLAWICRSICEARFSNEESGKPFAKSRSARRRAIRKSPTASARQERFEPSRKRVPQMLSQLRFPATGSCAAMAVFPATAGASNENEHCSRESSSQRERIPFSCRRPCAERPWIDRRAQPLLQSRAPTCDPMA
jgi:methylphosphotriester-DNA--protein-cysteine methyltransferase